MMKVLRRALILMFVFAAPAAAQPAPTLQWGDILIYQAEILDRVFPNEDQFSAYVGRLEGAATTGFGELPPQPPVAGVLFVAVKPGGRARVWVLPTSGSIAPDMRVRLERTLAATPAVEVRGGFLFAMSFGAWGAAPYQSTGAPPIPAEWAAQIPPQGVSLDDAFIDRVWPD
jgi:hypothetical protein